MAKPKKKTDNHTYTTEAGLVLHLKSISIYEMQAVEEAIKTDYMRKGELVEPPMYEVEVAGGGTQKHTLTAETLIKEGDEVETAKRKLDWQLYQDALDRMNKEVSQIQTMLMLEGIDVELPEPGSVWEKRCKRLHIPIPEDEDERMEFYKMSYVLRTTTDLIGVQAEIMQLSSGGAISDERKEAAKALFQRKLQEEPEG
jgi:hypothetical protein